MSAPLIEFSQLAHPHRWWLRRGLPPWLDDPRWYARAFRATLVMGVLGTLSGWLTVAGMMLVNWVDQSLPGSPKWITEGALGLFCGPGVWFGAGTLIPFSRWLGRGWLFSLLALPVSMFASCCGIWIFLFVGPIMGPEPGWIPGGKQAAGFYAGFAGAAVIAVWMGHPQRLEAWLSGISASLLASLVCGLYFVATQQSSVYASLPSVFQGILPLASLYVGFQSLTAVGLGVRLWWQPPVPKAVDAC